MAINLWKLGGKPTSYNPLPTGILNRITVEKGVDIILSFYAYSPSNTILQVTDGISIPYATITIPVFRTKYSYNIKTTTTDLYIYDVNGVGDIIIDSIEVVQKPTPLKSNNKSPLRVTKVDGGLVFDGTTQNIRFPSMTIDALEIECKLDNINGVLFQRYGSSSVYQFANGSTSGNVTTSHTGFLPVNERTKFRYTDFPIENTETSLFSNIVDASFVKGTVYKVTFYLAGKVVAQYDFTKPNNSKNLIPNFEDNRWSLHSNTQVLGKDVLRLNSTNTFQESIIYLDVKPNSNYKLIVNHSAYLRYDLYQTDGVTVVNTNGLGGTKEITLTTTSLTGKVKIILSNDRTGTFDFIKPQLYEVDVTGATITGSPKQIVKSSLENKYSLR